MIFGLRENAIPMISDTVTGNDTEVNFGQSANIPSLMYGNRFTVTDSSSGHFLKRFVQSTELVLSPISSPSSKTAVFRSGHSAKTSAPSVFTVPGIVTVSSPDPLKAWFPSFVTEGGIVIWVRLVHPLKAYPPIFSIAHPSSQRTSVSSVHP